VVADAGEHAHGVLREREQPAVLRGHAHAVQGVRVQHALRVVASLMDGAVDDEAGRVDRERRILDLVAVEVDLHEARRGDLVEEDAVGIDEELILGAGHAQRDVREDEVFPAEHRAGAIRGCEVDARRPFFGRNLVLERRNIEGGGLRHAMSFLV
jgi:hypothetical protein